MIFGRAYFQVMLIFESCLFKSHSIFCCAYSQNIWVSLSLKCWLTVSITLNIDRKRSFQEDPNSTFNEPFWGTPPTKRARKSYGPDFKTKFIKEAWLSSAASIT